MVEPSGRPRLPDIVPSDHIANPLDTVIVVYVPGRRRTGSMDPVRIPAQTTGRF